MTLDNNYNIQSWWQTPVVKFERPNAKDFNASLKKIILEKEQEIVGKGMPTKVAGLEDGLTAHWLEYNVLNWDFPECRELRCMALNGFDAFLHAAGMTDDSSMEIVGISCWANILRAGQALDVHHHDPAFVSAHYTVATGFENEKPMTPDSGSTVYFRPGFMDRSHGGTQNGWVSPWDDDWRITSSPVAGKMILFPSYVRHEVRPNLGSSERISIAMDFFVRKQGALMYFGGPRWFVPKKEDK
jgi:uncharacterized protein (TIGR02466 family)